MDICACVRLRARACALLGDWVPSVCIVSLLDCSASSKLALRDCFNAQHTPTLGAYLQELLRVRANAATHQRNRVTAPGECRCAGGRGGSSDVSSGVQRRVFLEAAKLRKRTEGRRSFSHKGTRLESHLLICVKVHQPCFTGVWFASVIRLLRCDPDPDQVSAGLSPAHVNQIQEADNSAGCCV